MRGMKREGERVKERGRYILKKPRGPPCSEACPDFLILTSAIQATHTNFLPLNNKNVYNRLEILHRAGLTRDRTKWS
jgi:hypothetical protein